MRFTVGEPVGEGPLVAGDAGGGGVEFVEEQVEGAGRAGAVGPVEG